MLKGDTARWRGRAGRKWDTPEASIREWRPLLNRPLGMSASEVQRAGKPHPSARHLF